MIFHQNFGDWAASIIAGKREKNKIPFSDKKHIYIYIYIQWRAKNKDERVF